MHGDIYAYRKVYRVLEYILSISCIANKPQSVIVQNHDPFAGSVVQYPSGTNAIL
jgi:hypothetical protein